MISDCSEALKHFARLRGNEVMASFIIHCDPPHWLEIVLRTFNCHLWVINCIPKSQQLPQISCSLPVIELEKSPLEEISVNEMALFWKLDLLKERDTRINLSLFENFYHEKVIVHTCQGCFSFRIFNEKVSFLVDKHVNYPIVAIHWCNVECRPLFSSSLYIYI